MTACDTLTNIYIEETIWNGYRIGGLMASYRLIEREWGRVKLFSGRHKTASLHSEHG